MKNVYWAQVVIITFCSYNSMEINDYLYAKVKRHIFEKVAIAYNDNKKILKNKCTFLMVRISRISKLTVSCILVMSCESLTMVYIYIYYLYMYQIYVHNLQKP